MYSKHSTSLINQQFWTVFGKYMLPILSADGQKINWINYKTGIKNIRINIKAKDKIVTIAIELSFADYAVQQQVWVQLLQFKKQFKTICGNNWQWQNRVDDDQGKTINQVIATLSGVSILNKTDWPTIISFLKPRLIKMDEFWCNYKFALG